MSMELNVGRLGINILHSPGGLFFPGAAALLQPEVKSLEGNGHIRWIKAGPAYSMLES